jgi:hypothetical protein
MLAKMRLIIMRNREGRFLRDACPRHLVSHRRQEQQPQAPRKPKRSNHSFSVPGNCDFTRQFTSFSFMGR